MRSVFEYEVQDKEGNSLLTRSTRSVAEAHLRLLREYGTPCRLVRRTIVIATTIEHVVHDYDTELA